MRPRRRYVLAVLENANSPDDGMILVKTGLVDGNGKEDFAALNEDQVVSLDEKLAAGILKNWEMFARSPEYPFIKFIKETQEKKKNV